MSTQINQVFFFADSLSDTGNVYNFTGQTFPGGLNDPFAPGRFSNGDVWTDYFTSNYNLTVDPLVNSVESEIDPITGDVKLKINTNFGANNDGINFSVGGARAGNGSVGPLPLGFQEQLVFFESYVQSPDFQTNIANSLIFVWGGANDYFSHINDDPSTPDIIETNFPQTPLEFQTAVSTVVEDNIGGGIQRIIDQGAENIVVFNLPDLSLTPLAQMLDPASTEALSDLSEAHNNLLSETVEQLEISNNIDILYIEADSLFNDVLNDPTAYGFTNVTDNYSGVELYTGISQPPATGDINDYLWVDSVHPTTKMHEIIGDFVIQSVEAEGYHFI